MMTLFTFKVWLALLTIFTTARHEIVLNQLYEGCANNENDIYLITYEGEEIEISSDDLLPGDKITVYSVGDYIIEVLYDWR